MSQILPAPTEPGYWWYRQIVIETRGRKHIRKIEHVCAWSCVKIVLNWDEKLCFDGDWLTDEIPSLSQDTRHEWVGPIQPPSI